MFELPWLDQDWSLALNTVGIVAGLLFNAFAIYLDVKSRRVANHIKLTQSHRELWTLMIVTPSLKRVINPKAELQKYPVTSEEHAFVVLQVQHLSTVLQAMKDGLTIDPDGFRKDVSEFFLLPIPNSVWNSIKGQQNKELADTIELLLKPNFSTTT